MAKRSKSPKTTITQEELQALYQRQMEAAEHRRAAKSTSSNVVEESEKLGEVIIKGRANVEPGTFRAKPTQITRRNPHYKDETAALAQKAGFDPDDYLEQCRERGSRTTYVRLRIVVE